MYEKDKLYYCGGSTENVFAICSICGRHTEKSDMVTTINNSFYDRLCRNAFQTGEYILISGELPEKWK